jgi:putative addiction module CopG family antidote
MPAKNGRNVALTDEQHAFVERMVKSGRYASASEVVRDGLRLLQRDEEARLLDKWLVEGLTTEEQASIPPDVLNRARDAIRAKVREGLDEARRGEFVYGDEFFARWKARLENATSAGRESGVKRRRAGTEPPGGSPPRSREAVRSPFQNWRSPQRSRTRSGRPGR